MPSNTMHTGCENGSGYGINRWFPRVTTVLLLFTLLIGGATAATWTTYTDAAYVGGLDVEGGTLWAGTNGGVLHWTPATDSYQKLTTVDGLVEHRVLDVLVDASGNKWFGTAQGLQMYDGSTWITYDTSNSPLPDDTVYALAQAPDGALWIGTAFGCARLDDDVWEVFTDLGDGATNVAVRGIGVDSLGRVWTANNPDDYGTPGGVSMYDGSTWTRHDPDTGSIGQYFLSLTVDQDDNVWAGSWTNWVFRYDGSAWTHFDSDNSGLVGQNIEAFTVDDDGNVWIANHASSMSASTNGIAKFDGTNWTSYTTANSGLPSCYVYAMATRNRTLYCGTASSGIAGFDGTDWSYYETENEPICNWITSIDQGAVTGIPLVFLGTDHAGVAVFDGATWSSYTPDNSSLGDYYINDVHVADGTLWMGARYTGVWSYDGDSWRNHHSGNSGMLCDNVLSVATDSQGNLWLGTSGWDGPSGQDGAVARFDGVAWTNYYLTNSGLIDDDGLSVAVDPDDMIWIGTEEGANRFDGTSSWTSYTTGNSGLINDHVEAIAFDEGGCTWFATLGGVSCFNGTTWASFTTANGLPSNSVKDITVADGVIWAATTGGVAVYQPREGWTAYTPADGLADENVTAVCAETTDAVWFGTYRSGISVHGDQTTDIDLPSGELASSFLHPCFPNPFNPSTTIRYDLPGSSRVSLSIYDIAGRLVRRLVDGLVMSAGAHTIEWDGRNDAGESMAAGVYVYRIDADTRSQARRMVLVK